MIQIAHKGSINRTKNQIIKGRFFPKYLELYEISVTFALVKKILNLKPFITKNF